MMSADGGVDGGRRQDGRRWPWLGAACLAVLLAGCGGGGGGGSSSPAGPGTPEEPQATESTVRGTVAIGAPLRGAQVRMKCAGSTSTVYSATADEAGRYELSGVPLSAGPCLLRANFGRYNYGSALAVVRAGSVTANVTPLTHLQVTRLLGQDAAAAFDRADAALFARITWDGLSAAKGDVLAQLNRLGMNSGTLSPDWIEQSFAADPGDQMDRSLEELQAQLDRAGLTVEAAAGQLAASDAALQLPSNWQPTYASCRPGLLGGFNGEDRSKWIRVPAADSGGDGSAGGGAGAGAGGGLGQFLDVTVTVEFADGTRLGPVKTDTSKGMVTIVPCDLAQKVPALVRFHGEAGAKYYDEGRGELVSFEGHAVYGVVSHFEQDKNIAVTSFTEAVYRRIEQLASARATDGGYRLKAVDQAWKDPARIQIAHDEVLAAVNDQLPGIYRLTELDRMPITLNQQTDVEGSEALPKTEIGIHGAVLAALAKTAASNRPNDPAPALTMTKDFAADLADGLIDNPLARLAAEGAVAPGVPVLPSYEVESLWRGMSMNTAATGIHAGVPAFKTDKPFPFGLYQQNTYRAPLERVYVGKFSDGIVRTILLASEYEARLCAMGSDAYYCNPVRKVAASPEDSLEAHEWWIFEWPEFVNFDIDTLVATRADGSATVFDGFFVDEIQIAPAVIYPEVRDLVLFRNSSGQLYAQDGSGGSPVPLADAEDLTGFVGLAYSYDTFLDQGDREFRLFGIDANGFVQLLTYDLTHDAFSQLQLSFISREEIALPGPARQLSSDGRTVIALLTNGDVYTLNPEVLVATVMGPSDSPECGIDSMERFTHACLGVIPGMLDAKIPIRMEGASNICWIGGVYLVECTGQMLQIDRRYWSVSLPTPGMLSFVEYPGFDYEVVPVDRFSIGTWRAYKAPLAEQTLGGDKHFRLLVDRGGSYVLQSDRFGTDADWPESNDFSAEELSQALVESWFPGVIGGGAL